ncbi:tRNA-His guanylyltransferase [Lithohypha guttulata]|uniref:tRNA(His) guanylyltransferase n=1 Tax=Lithohypha guttulata TaxID=1690604 RepID=A0AAN7SZI5_9EURO|nr:tRNA-His guanylyltransferase [Lithohypha guttulata]
MADETWIFEYVRQFEREEYLLPNTWIVVRIDGRGFHKYVSFTNLCKNPIRLAPLWLQARISNHYGFVKPNDIRALDLMNAAAQHVLHVLHDIMISYGHSDEYSFVFHKSCTLFERRSAKIASTVVSTFTAAYIHLWPRYFAEPAPTGTFLARHSNGGGSTNVIAIEGNPQSQETSREKADLAISHLPTFDARCISYPSNHNLKDYLSWRQADCHINNLYNTTFWALVLKGGMSNTEAEEFLKGTLSSDKNEILWSRYGINYNNEKEIFKKGSVVLREYKMLEPTEAARRIDIDVASDLPKEDELSKTKREKIRKARQKADVVVRHIDIIKDDFWQQRPWLLTGQPGSSV